MQVWRKLSLHCRLAVRALFDFGIHVFDDLLEQDDDIGAPLMVSARDICEWLATDITMFEMGNGHGLAH